MVKKLNNLILIFFTCLVVILVARKDSCAGGSMSFLPILSSNRIEIATATSVNSLLNISCSYWVKRSTRQNGGVIYSKGPNNNDRNPSVALRGNDGATPGGTIDRSVTDALFTGDNFADVIPTGTWTFGAFTYNGVDGGRLFQGYSTSSILEDTYNGARQVGSGSDLDTSSITLVIGGTPPPTTTPFPGLMGVITCWNKTLSQKEIQESQWDQNFSTGVYLQMFLGWNGNGIQYDFSGSSNPGTVFGATPSDEGPPIFFVNDPMN